MNSTAKAVASALNTFYIIQELGCPDCLVEFHVVFAGSCIGGGFFLFLEVVL